MPRKGAPVPDEGGGIYKVVIPAALIRRIDEYIAHDHEGLTTRSDFAAEAVRRLLREYEA